MSHTAEHKRSAAEIITDAVNAAGVPGSIPDLGSPVGVDAGFTVNVPLPQVSAQRRAQQLGLNLPQTTVPMPAVFYENDLHNPVALPAEERRRLNQTMYDLGLFGSKKNINLDTWDDNHISAYARLLYIGNTIPVRAPAGMSEKQKKDWQRDQAVRFLRDSGASAARAQAAERPAPPPLTVRLTSSKDLSRIVDDVAVQTRGRRLSKEEVARFVASYNAEERGAQARTYAATYGAGGVVEQEASAQGAAEAFVQEIDPLGVEGKSVASAFGAFQQLLGGGG